MFLLRCTFWLAVGFLVVKPFALDTNSASAMADMALDTGKKMAVEQLLNAECNDPTCATLKTATMITVLTSKLPEHPAERQIMVVDAPIPPLRPDWAS